jgi:hypothetical protein
LTSPLTEQLRRTPPGLHGAGDEYWGLAWTALAWLEREIQPGMATLETGAGSSTIVFAAGGAHHVAVTPDAEEEERIREQCDRLGVDHSRVRFEIGPSHDVLPRLHVPPLDLVLVDGAHGFPYPILDWWYSAPHLKIGGRILLDDAFMPPIGVLVDALRAQPGWQVVGAAGHRTVVVQKTSAELPGWDWEGERLGGRMNFRYLPARERAAGSLGHRLFRTRFGFALVRLARRRSGLTWHKKG